MNSTPFAVLLKLHRERMGWTRADLARESGLSYPYVSQLETGMRKPSRKAALELARALGVDAQVLEGSIPGDDTDYLDLQRARTHTDQVLSGSRPPASRPAMAMLRSERQAGRTSEPDREDLLGDILDLLEEFGVEDRLEVLAEVQKRAMQRILDDRDRRAT
ncbi:MAG: helix-turn-helix domain-containing protein [Aeromicrobium sp.]